MPRIRETLARNLKSLLAERDVSQSDLQRALKVSFPTINGLANAKTGVSEDMISKISEFFGIEETDLVSPTLFQPQKRLQLIPGRMTRGQLFDVLTALDDDEFGAVLKILGPFIKSVEDRKNQA